MNIFVIAESIQYSNDFALVGAKKAKIGGKKLSSRPIKKATMTKKKKSDLESKWETIQSREKDDFDLVMEAGLDEELSKLESRKTIEDILSAEISDTELDALFEEKKVETYATKRGSTVSTHKSKKLFKKERKAEKISKALNIPDYSGEVDKVKSMGDKLNMVTVRKKKKSDVQRNRSAEEKKRYQSRQSKPSPIVNDFDAFLAWKNNERPYKEPRVRYTKEKVDKQVKKEEAAVFRAAKAVVKRNKYNRKKQRQAEKKGGEFVPLTASEFENRSLIRRDQRAIAEGRFTDINPDDNSDVKKCEQSPNSRDSQRNPDDKDSKEDPDYMGFDQGASDKASRKEVDCENSSQKPDESDSKESYDLESRKKESSTRKDEDDYARYEQRRPERDSEPSFWQHIMEECEKMAYDPKASYDLLRLAKYYLYGSNDDQQIAGDINIFMDRLANCYNQVISAKHDPDDIYRKTYALMMVIAPTDSWVIKSFVVILVRRLYYFFFPIQVANAEMSINDIEIILEHGESFVAGDVYGAIRQIVMSTASMCNLPDSLKYACEEIFNFKSSSLRRPSLLHVAKDVVSSLVKLARLVEVYIRGGDIMSCILGSNPIIELKKRGPRLRDLHVAGMVSVNPIIEGSIHRTDFMIQLKEVLRGPRAMDTRMLASDTQAHSLFMDLIRIETSYINRVRSEHRIPPVCIIIQGFEGIGKSSILKMTQRIVMAALNIPWNNGLVYTKSVGDKYWEKHEPLTQPIIYLPELAIENSKYAAHHGISDSIKQLLQLVTSDPYSLEMAFGGKGDCYACPMLVIGDTNNKSLNIREFSHRPGAFGRRIIFITPEVKPEFRQLGSHKLDSTKALAAEDPYDLWTFKIEKTEDFRDWQTIVDCSDHKDYSSWVFDHTRRHFAEESKVKDRVATYEVPIHTGEARSESLVTLLRPFRPVKSFFRMCGWFCMYALMDEFFDSLQYTGETLCDWKSMLMGIFAWLVCFSLSFAFNLPFILVSIMLCMISAFIAYTVYWGNVLSLCISCGRKLAPAHASQMFRREKQQFLLDCGYIRLEQAMDRSASTFRALCSNPLVLGGIACATAGATYWFTTRRRMKACAQSTLSNFSEEIKEDSVIHAIEEETGCDVSRVRIANAFSTQWNVQEKRQPIGAFSGSGSEFEQVVTRNIRSFVILTDGKEAKGNLLGLYSNYAVMNKHYLLTDNVELRVCNFRGYYPVDYKSTNVLRMNLTPSDYVSIHDDVVLVRLRCCNFTNIMSHLPIDDAFSCLSYNAQIRGVSTRATFVKDQSLDVYAGSEKQKVTNFFQYHWPNHLPGVCGTPLIVSVNGTWMLAGIHGAAITGEDLCFAYPITRKAVEDNMFMLRTAYEPASAEWRSDALLLPPKNKSPVRFIVLDKLLYRGRYDRMVCVDNKSNLVRTQFEVEQFFLENFNFVPADPFCKPILKPTRVNGEYVSPVNNSLIKMNVGKMPLKTEILLRAIDIISDRVIPMLQSRDVVLKPINMEVAINGVDHDIYMRSVNINTAAGHGWFCKKNKLISVVEGKKMPNPELRKVLAERMSEYKRGVSNEFVFLGLLKDEPRPLSKVRVGKTRMFFASPVDMLVIERMYVGPILTLLIEHPDIFYTAIGIDMHREAVRIAELREFSVNVMAGDFSDFDVKMPICIAWATRELICRIARTLGYNEEAMVMLCGVLTDSMFVSVDINGDIFVNYGLQASGKYGTAEENSLRSLIMLVYAYIILTRRVDFFDMVRSALYGDDNYSVVKDEVAGVFNNISYRRVCAEHFQMGYTSFDKGDITSPFDDIDAVDFLKRKIKYSDRLGMWLAPLVEATMYKMLEWVIPSKHMSSSDQILAICNSFLDEVFQYDSQELFEKCRLWLRDQLVKHYGFTHDDCGALVRYHVVLNRICPQEDHGVEEEHEPQMKKTIVGQDRLIAFAESRVKVRESSGLTTESRGVNEPREDFYTFAMFKTSLQNMRNDLLEEIKVIEHELKELAPPLGGLAKLKVIRSSAYLTDPVFRTYADKYFTLKKRLEDRNCMLVRVINTIEDCKAEMDTAQIENIVDVRSGVDADTQASTNISMGVPTSYDLDLFFKRPVSILKLDLPLNAPYNISFDPWSRYFDDPTVRSKLRNYAFVRATLHVEIQLSGMPFHYGKVYAAYVPFAKFNDTYNFYDASPAFEFQKKQFLVSTRHTLIMDVGQSERGEMVIPFFAPQMYARLVPFASQTQPATSDYADISDLGRIDIGTLNDISATSADPSDPYIHVYAWLSDVQLGGITSFAPVITTESDERKTGPLEGMASSLLEGASVLQDLPIIGPYAKASKYPLNVAKNVSAHYGWSYPTVISHPMRMKGEPFQNAANTIGSDTGHRITIDPLQELSVDPRIAGTTGDDLVVAAIASRWGLLSQVVWTTSDLSLGPALWSCKVSPFMKEVEPSGLNQPTPLFFAAIPFQSWRGEICIRIEVADSAFHRGKLAIVYDPDCKNPLVTTAAYKLNKQAMIVMDLQETNCMDIRIPWNMPRKWANCNPAASKVNDESTTPASVMNSINGLLSITPFSELQSPNSAPAYINIYVKSHSCEFMAPSEKHLPLRRVAAESAVTRLNDSGDCMTIAQTVDDDKGHYDIHFGESVASFRSLLKRFYCEASLPLEYNTPTVSTLHFSLYPLPVPRYDAPALQFPSLYSYLRLAFLAMKGGRRFRYFVSKYKQDTNRAVFVTLSPFTELAFTEPFITLSSDLTENQMRLEGTSMFLPETNAGIEFELPYYSTNMWEFACYGSGNFSGSTMAEPLWAQYGSVSEIVSSATVAPVDHLDRVYLWGAAGEDFSFMNFVSPPAYYDQN